MKTNTKHFVHGLMLLPFLSLSSSFAMINSKLALLGTDGQTPSVVSTSVSQDQTLSGSDQAQQALDLERAQKIDTYFADRDMPLEGYGKILVAAAEKNGIDWRLLPAIAIKESTGGKYSCGNNPFGWGSCKIKFKSVESAIDTVARNLGGKNPATEQYYKDASTKEKLFQYNGSVVPTYTGEVLKFMELIDKVDTKVA